MHGNKGNEMSKKVKDKVKHKSNGGMNGRQVLSSLTRSQRVT